MPDAVKQITLSLVNSQEQKLTVWLFTKVRNAKCALSTSSRTRCHARISQSVISSPCKIQTLTSLHIETVLAHRDIQQQLVAGSLAPELAFINALVVSAI